MRQVTLNISDGKFDAFMGIIKDLDFVQIQETHADMSDSETDIITNVTQGFIELKAYNKGEIEFTSAQDFLDEL